MNGMSGLILGIWIILIIGVVGIAALVLLACYEYKEYLRILEENDCLAEDPPLIKK